MKKFLYQSYTECRGDEYVTITKIFADLPPAAFVAIGETEKWDGNHWDRPDLIYSEIVPGTDMSKKADDIIISLNAQELR